MVACGLSVLIFAGVAHHREARRKDMHRRMILEAINGEVAGGWRMSVVGTLGSDPQVTSSMPCQSRAWAACLLRCCVARVFGRGCDADKEGPLLCWEQAGEGGRRGASAWRAGRPTPTCCRCRAGTRHCARRVRMGWIAAQCASNGLRSGSRYSTCSSFVLVVLVGYGNVVPARLLATMRWY